MSGMATGSAELRVPTPDAVRRPLVVAVVGPTATGKSALGVDLALALSERGSPSEIINADSMQIYRGMDVGTAKLTADERRGVTHHLLDIWSVTRTASVADYQRHARARLDAIVAGGGVPVIVGGSGLYVRAVIDRLEFPGTDDRLRAELEAELLALGAAALHTRLAAVDPAAAAAILPTNGRRIVRALEVIALTGKPFTAALPSYDSVYDDRYDLVQIGLDLPPDDLDARIDERTRQMFDAGLIDEVRTLEQAGLRDGRTASRALGYQQVLAMVDGLLSEPEARAETAQATRRFVRRQRSWFRRDPRIHWLSPAPDLLARALTTIRVGGAG
jgi:tRNA dimethylallyltransferase